MARYGINGFGDERYEKQTTKIRGQDSGSRGSLSMGGISKDTELPPVPVIVVPGQPPWLDLAKKYLGEHELAGSKDDNPFIVECFKYTTYQAIHDEVPWCAAFICKVLEDTGYKSTKSAAANSYLEYGEPCNLKPGAILVFHWPAGGQHVTICDKIMNDTLVTCLGGNQSDSVKDSNFNRAYIKACRWPVK